MRKYKRLQQRIQGTLPHVTKVKVGTVAVRHSANGTQCAGQIQYQKSFRRKLTPTFDTAGDLVHIVSGKVKVTPSSQWKGYRNHRTYVREYFPRNQRIELAKIRAKKARHAFYAGKAQ